ncbi:uncharacterized protein EV422DRAFT_56805 [Fimicolochytrium jonesii]|uniref:uncharacterized protein n=1 Tax=Fimicolochytrium jonesii TaxID=1396493 RepID=UPI0022FE960A|nr:uncharacterized protein EV422DRAFT_56805 [Fimicolochytrium jonesii]KAI8821177.1 hypothetical protein EV422DRAFT_56805 [Fimicolochytrium jonesii]
MVGITASPFLVGKTMSYFPFPYSQEDAVDSSFSSTASSLSTSSDLSVDNNPGAGAGSVKKDETPLRDACQPCRARKIRCSGQEDGCDRCKSLQKTCIYLPRQKLGRPSTKSQKFRASARHLHGRSTRDGSSRGSASKKGSAKMLTAALENSTRNKESGSQNVENSPMISRQTTSTPDMTLQRSAVNMHDMATSDMIAHMFDLPNSPPSPPSSLPSNDTCDSTVSVSPAEDSLRPSRSTGHGHLLNCGFSSVSTSTCSASEDEMGGRVPGTSSALSIQSPSLSSMASSERMRQFPCPPRRPINHHVCFLSLSSKLLKNVLGNSNVLSMPSNIPVLSLSSASSRHQTQQEMKEQPQRLLSQHQHMSRLETFQLIELFFLFHPLSYLVNKTLLLRAQSFLQQDVSNTAFRSSGTSHSAPFLASFTAFSREPLVLVVLASASCLRQSMGSCNDHDGDDDDDGVSSSASGSHCRQECDDLFSMALDAIYMRVDGCFELDTLQTLLIVILQHLMLLQDEAGSEHPTNSRMKETLTLLHLAWASAQALVPRQEVNASRARAQPTQNGHRGHNFQQQHGSVSRDQASAGGKAGSRQVASLELMTTLGRDFEPVQRGSVSEAEVQDELINFCWWTCAVFSLYARLICGLPTSPLLSALDDMPRNAALLALQNGSLSSRYDAHHRNRMPASVYASSLNMFVSMSEMCLLAARIVARSEQDVMYQSVTLPSRLSPPGSRRRRCLVRTACDEEIRLFLMANPEPLTLAFADSQTGRIRLLLYQILAVRLASEDGSQPGSDTSPHHTDAALKSPTAKAITPDRSSSHHQGEPNGSSSAIDLSRLESALRPVQPLLSTIASMSGGLGGAAITVPDEICQRELFDLCAVGIEMCVDVSEMLSDSLSLWLTAATPVNAGSFPPPSDSSSPFSSSSASSPADLMSGHPQQPMVLEEWDTWKRLHVALLDTLHKACRLLNHLLPTTSTSTVLVEKGPVMLHHRLQGLLARRQHQHYQLRTVVADQAAAAAALCPPTVQATPTTAAAAASGLLPPQSLQHTTQAPSQHLQGYLNRSMPHSQLLEQQQHQKQQLQQLQNNGAQRQQHPHHSQQPQVQYQEQPQAPSYRSDQVLVQQSQSDAIPGGLLPQHHSFFHPFLMQDQNAHYAQLTGPQPQSTIPPPPASSQTFMPLTSQHQQFTSAKSQQMDPHVLGMHTTTDLPSHHASARLPHQQHHVAAPAFASAAAPHGSNSQALTTPPPPASSTSAPGATSAPVAMDEFRWETLSSHGITRFTQLLDGSSMFLPSVVGADGGAAAAAAGGVPTSSTDAAAASSAAAQTDPGVPATTAELAAAATSILANAPLVDETGMRSQGNGGAQQTHLHQHHAHHAHPQQQQQQQQQHQEHHQQPPPPPNTMPMDLASFLKAAVDTWVSQH